MCTSAYEWEGATNICHHSHVCFTLSEGVMERLRNGKWEAATSLVIWGEFLVYKT